MKSKKIDKYVKDKKKIKYKKLEVRRQRLKKCNFK